MIPAFCVKMAFDNCKRLTKGKFSMKMLLGYEKRLQIVNFMENAYKTIYNK